MLAFFISFLVMIITVVISVFLPEKIQESDITQCIIGGLVFVTAALYNAKIDPILSKYEFYKDMMNDKDQ